MSNLNLLKNHEGKQKLFPAHVEIEFTTDVNTQFSYFLRDSNLASVLMKEIIMDSIESWGKWSTVDLPDSDSSDPRSIQLENKNYLDYPVYNLVLGSIKSLLDHRTWS